MVSTEKTPSPLKSRDAILHLASELAQKFSERAAGHDNDSSFPYENFEDLRAVNYPLLSVPAEYGGWGANLLDAVMAQEILGQGDGSTALAITMHVQVIGGEAALRTWRPAAFEWLCREIVERRVLVNACSTEPEMGSPSRGGLPRTTASRAEQGWILNGHKNFATMSPVLDYFLTSAAIQDTEPSMGIFLVPPQPGVTIEPTWDSLGMRATASHDILLKDAHVEDKLLVAQFPTPPTGSRLGNNAWFTLTVSAVYLGVAAAAQQIAIDYAHQRIPTALGKPIATLESIQRRLGESELALQVARTLLYSTAEDWDRYPEQRNNMGERLAIAKLVVTNHAIQIVDAAMRVVGGTSMNNTSPLARYYRDVRAGLYHPPNDDAALPALGQIALQRRRG